MKHFRDVKALLLVGAIASVASATAQNCEEKDSLAVGDTRSVISNALISASESSNLAEKVQIAWNNIPKELRAINTIERQLINPSPEFIAYLEAVVADSENSMRHLYDNNVLAEFGPQRHPEYGNEHFMNVRMHLEDKLSHINNRIAALESSLSNGIYHDSLNPERTSYYLNSRNSQKVAAENLIRYLDQNPQASNVAERYEQAIFGTAKRLNEVNLDEASYTLMTQSSVNPIIAYSLMMQETFRASPFPPAVEFLIAQAMMNAGYEPNFRVSSNAHLTMGFPHITYETFTRYVNQAHIENPNHLQFNIGVPKTINPNFTAESFAESVIDPNDASQLFYGISFHNVNRLENHIRRLGNQRALSFINSPNTRAFAAITALFNHYGSNPPEWELIVTSLTEANYVESRFVEILAEKESYVKTAMTTYDYLSSQVFSNYE